MRRNLRLDWRALALLGALLSFIIAWPGLVFAMPALTMPNHANNSSRNNSNNNNNINAILNNSNVINIQSDHSHSKVQSDHSLNQNQSISAKINIRTFIHQQKQNRTETAITNPTIDRRTTTTTSNVETAVTSDNNNNNNNNDNANANDNDDSFEQKLLGFVFSALPSDQLAILSRTERSIRHHQQQQQDIEEDQLGAPATADKNFIGSKSKRLNNYRNNLPINSSNNPSNLDRNERSTVSHLAGPSRKIQLYIKNRFIQLLPDGTVNGTPDDKSEYTILQRSTVDVGRIKIQSVATCLYLCMDACGTAYGSKDFTDDCVFNENMEPHNYNTYSSTYNSNARRIYYLALNRRGEPRRTQIPPTRSLGKLSTYTNAITEPVPQERVEQLIAKNFGANRIKHGVRQLCDTGKPLIELIDGENFKARPQCTLSGSSTGFTGGSGGSGGAGGGGQATPNNVPGSKAAQLTNSSASSLISISSNSSQSGHISSSNSSNINISSSNTLINSSNSSSSSSNSSSSSSNNNNNNSSSSHQHKKQKKKLRKCRLNENEREHNCTVKPAAGAGALRKRGGSGGSGVKGPKQQRCKELQESASPPTLCANKRGGPKRNGGGKGGHGKLKNNGNHARKQAVENGSMVGKKKQPKPGRARQNVGGKKRGGRNGASSGAAGGKRGGQKPKQKWVEASTTTTMATSLATPRSSWESSSAMPSLSLSDTSDRVEREQRNVHMSKEYTEASSEEAVDEDEGLDLEEATDSQETEDSYEDPTNDVHAPPLVSGSTGDYYEIDHQ